MGFRICYIASPQPTEDLARGLGLEITRQSDDQPADGWWVARLKACGWSILWSEDEDFGKSARAALADLSQSAEVLFCEVNETVMWSSAECISKGESLWRVTHAGDGPDRYDLTVTGTPPATFPDLRARLEAEQKADDGNVDFIFEIPLDLAAEKHGFRHDQFLNPDEVEGFHILRGPGRKRGLFGLLFRR